MDQCVSSCFLSSVSRTRFFLDIPRWLLSLEPTCPATPSSSAWMKTEVHNQSGCNHANHLHTYTNAPAPSAWLAGRELFVFGWNDGLRERVLDGRNSTSHSERMMAPFTMFSYFPASLGKTHCGM